MSTSSVVSVTKHDSSKARIESVVENDLKVCGVVASKERTAWYLCDVANSLFGGFAMSVLVPLLLANLAELRAYDGNDGTAKPQVCADLAQKDWTVHCSLEQHEKGICVFHKAGQPDQPITTACRTCIIGNGKKLWNQGADHIWQLSDEVKDVPFFGFQINYLSYATWIISISVLMQAVFFALLAPLADYGKQKKQLLLSCSFLGALCCILFVTAEDDNAYITVGILTVLANIFFGLSLVAYDAFLPIIVDAHKKISDTDVADMSETDKDELRKFRMDHESEMSSKGYTYGYIGQFIGMLFGCSIIGVGTYLLTVEQRENIYHRDFRISMTFVGVWWFFWTLPAVFWLKHRASPPLPIERTNLCAMALFGLGETWKSLCLAKKYFNTWRMLATFFFYSDMYNTITFVGVLVARDHMCFNTYQLIAIALLLVFMSAIGGYSVLYTTKKWGFNAKSVIETCLVVYACLSLWFISGIWSDDFGFRAHWELYVFACIHGFILGPVQSYSRALFADFIPLHHESSFFSMYAITDKGSSWLGPAIVGVVANSDVDIRYSGFYLLAVSLLPAIVLHFCVNHKKGMADVGRLLDVRPASDGDESVKRDHFEVKLEHNNGIEDSVVA